MNPDTKEQPESRHTILVVDDDPGILLMAGEAFYGDNFDVVTVSSGEEALAKIEAVNPDVILLDIMMPGMDGFDTCLGIRALADFENTPVIMLTGMEDVSAVDRAYEVGAWDFISKPINWPILRYRVSHCLRSFDAFSNERIAARLSKTLDNSSNEIIVFDAQTKKICSANTSAMANLGYDQEALDKLCFQEVTLDLSESDLAEKMESLKESQQISLSLSLRRSDGSSYPVDGTFLYNSDEKPHVCICIFQDVTERQKTEQRLHQLAYYDDLTGLPNRRLFEKHVHKALASARRNHTFCAVCIVDLDGFKAVNDAFGHSRGDVLLQQVTDRLSSQLRQSDVVLRMNVDVDPGHAQLELARLGGDEFLLLLTDFDDTLVPARVADRLLKSISTPYHLDDKELNITASMGISLFPQDGDCLDVLMPRAEVAMYSTKKAGKNNYAYYSQDSGMNSMARLTLETEMRKALDRDEFELFYQPQVDGYTGRIAGVEALIRWRHPERGLVPPGEFISVAEDSGLIIPLGDWVVQTAAAQLTRWVGLYGPQFKCAVNISGTQLRQDDFLDTTRDVLAKLAPTGGRLVVELTESSIMTTNASRLEWMQEIREMGAEIAIDDFGTGYSSLSYLKKLPIDYLKIDRSFIIDLVSNPDDRIITNTVFLMAQALGLEVVVEGVEEREQLTLINQMGMSLIQGYLFTPPLPVSDLEAWIANHESQLALSAVAS